MDVDPPIFTRVRCAYTEDDKNCYKKEGRCFNCNQQGHMAHECPKKKQQFGQSNQSSSYKPQDNQLRTTYKPIFKKKPFGSKPMGQGFRKKNQFNYKPQIRTAYIKDAEEQGNEDEQEYIRSLAARIAKLSDDQREQWVEEMRDMGINFQ